MLHSLHEIVEFSHHGTQKINSKTSVTISYFDEDMTSLPLNLHFSSLKILESLLAFNGLMTSSDKSTTIYKGPVIRKLGSEPIHITRHTVDQNWIKILCFTIASCISWSESYIMQEYKAFKYFNSFGLAPIFLFYKHTCNQLVTMLKKKKRNQTRIRLSLVVFR